MPAQFLMPRLGESVDEATLTKWLKKQGESVRELEPLLEVNTDKVDTELPSPASGVLLAVLVEEGATVRVGTPLAWIGEPGEALPKERAPAVAAVEVSVSVQEAPAQPSPASGNRGFISPVVARIAAEQGVDLSKVSGTGLGGRITKKDVLAYVEGRAAAPQAAEGTPVQSGLPAGAAPAATIPPRPVQPAGQAGEAGFIPHTPVRRSIAEHMTFSKRTSPHVTTVMEADLSAIVAHRQAHKAEFAQKGVNLTFTAYFVAASVAALKAHPLVNASWEEQGIRLHRDIHIGMATSLGEAGLIVPVIHHADGLSLVGLARAINDLANRARSRELKPDEVKGGTFTITNHGVSSSLFATPIINQPQCAILGVGAIQKRVVVVESEALGETIAIRPIVYLSLTFDHRILDGEAADGFLAKVVEYLESWEKA